MRHLVCIVVFLTAWNALQSQGCYQLRDIAIEGNKVTRDFIVLREVELKLDSSYCEDDIERLAQNSADNLMRTRLFNFAELVPTYQDSTVSITIKVTERWYIFPLPVFELADPNFNIWWETRDFNRVNVGLNVDHNNFLGLADKLSLRFKWGYNRELGFAYNKPYINKERTVGASVSVKYQQRYEVIYATAGNERSQFARLGESIREEWHNKLDVYYRPGNRFTSYFTLWQRSTQVSDSVRLLAPRYYGDRTRLDYLGFSFYFVYDSRDLPSYPLNGWFGSLELAHPGINPAKNYDFGIYSTKLVVNHFRPISKRLFWAGGVNAGVLSARQLPYFFQFGFGISGNVRGHEFTFIDAQRYAVIKNNVKLALLRGKEINLPLIKNPSFGRVPIDIFLGTHVDLAYTEDDLYSFRNPLDRQWLVGYGLGLDFVTYYDKVFRVEYSWNRFGQSGLYLHFKKAI